jgi:hypothetical protein
MLSISKVHAVKASDVTELAILVLKYRQNRSNYREKNDEGNRFFLLDSTLCFASHWSSLSSLFEGSLGLYDAISW